MLLRKTYESYKITSQLKKTLANYKVICKVRKENPFLEKALPTQRVKDEPDHQ